MQRLVILRHAKSSWKDVALSDHQRPLNRRGRKSAAAIAGELERLDWLPNQVASSDSARTRETWGIMAETIESLSGFIDIEWLSQLYHAGATTMHEVIEERVGTTSASTGVLMVIGHNPGCSCLLSRLCAVEHKFPTAMAACLSRAEGTERWVVEHLILPRELMAKTE
ncbi:MAG: histidine phosphatase family protein [Pseudomonadales bacterium]|nr:histidine phosphatase family protein [Pseudomonadales bacterium]